MTKPSQPLLYSPGVIVSMRKNRSCRRDGAESPSVYVASMTLAPCCNNERAKLQFNKDKKTFGLTPAQRRKRFCRLKGLSPMYSASEDRLGCE